MGKKERPTRPPTEEESMMLRRARRPQSDDPQPPRACTSCGQLAWSLGALHWRCANCGVWYVS